MRKSSGADRKQDHIELALRPSSQSGWTGLSRFRFVPKALPEIAFEEVALSTRFLGKQLEAPLLISSMTAGTPRAAVINRRLAICAQKYRIAFGLGSLRKLVEEGKRAGSDVRRLCPDAVLLANLGAVQLNYGFDAAKCRRAVDLVQADALVLHLNPLQEVLQPEGNTDFRGLLRKIEEVVKKTSVPVIVKEVGSGLDGETARRLYDIGVRIVDTAGAGGTSFALIESRRRGSARLAKVFDGWGLSTAESIRACSGVKGMSVIGSGGIRTGLDAALAIRLGACLVGMARPFMQAAVRSPAALDQLIRNVLFELRAVMFAVGARDLKSLRRARLIEDPPLPGRS